MIKDEIKGLIKHFTDAEIISICEFPSKIVVQLLDDDELSIEVMTQLLTELKNQQRLKTGTSNNNTNVIKIKINLDSRMYQKIDLMFSTLNDISQLLNSSEKNINSQEEAKLYLLTQLKDLMALSDNISKDAFIYQLNQFIPYWLIYRHAPTNLQIEGRVISIEGKAFIKINGLKNIPIEIPRKFKSYNFKGLQSLNLIKIDKNFAIEIDIQNYVNSKKVINKYKKSVASNSCSRNKQHLNRKKIIRVNNQGRHVGTPYILKRMEEYLRFAEKVNRAFVRPDFDKLEGWHTQGGLPTLGKRR